MTADAAHASFSNMVHSTAKDWGIIKGHFVPFARGLPERIVAHLKLLDGDYGGYPIDRLQHSLQTATRAYRGGEDEEYMVCALLHDIGDTLATMNHPDVGAAVVKPFVSEANHWMVEKHGIFQGYYFFHHLGMDRDMREQFRGHPHFERTAKFCEVYDAPAFDPAGEILPLDFFMPMLKRVFETPKNTIYTGMKVSSAA
jgi:predicted HD phosphohydrolase